MSTSCSSWVASPRKASWRLWRSGARDPAFTRSSPDQSLNNPPTCRCPAFAREWGEVWAPQRDRDSAADFPGNGLPPRQEHHPQVTANNINHCVEPLPQGPQVQQHLPSRRQLHGEDRRLWSGDSEVSVVFKRPTSPAADGVDTLDGAWGEFEYCYYGYCYCYYGYCYYGIVWYCYYDTMDGARGEFEFSDPPSYVPFQNGRMCITKGCFNLHPFLLECRCLSN